MILIALTEWLFDLWMAPSETLINMYYTPATTIKVDVLTVYTIKFKKNWSGIGGISFWVSMSSLNRIAWPRCLMTLFKIVVIVVEFHKICFFLYRFKEHSPHKMSLWFFNIQKHFFPHSSGQTPILKTHKSSLGNKNVESKYLHYLISNKRIYAVFITKNYFEFFFICL